MGNVNSRIANHVKKLEEENQALRKELETVNTENLSLKDWVWHKKYLEASSNGAAHEVASQFAHDGIRLLTKGQ